MSYVESRFVDTDRNAAFDHADRTYFYTDASGKIDYTVREVDAGNDGTINQRQITDKIYNGGDKLISEYFASDNDGNGIYEVEAFRSLSYDSAGRVLTDRNDSWDLNGDVAPDYSSILTNTWNSLGQYETRETVYLVDGVNDPSAYRLETYQYNTKGLLSELTIRDDALLDFDIGYKYTYNSSGKLTRVQYRDEFVFNDNLFHNAETYKYASNGRLIESNKYAEVMNGMYVLEDKMKVSYYSSGLVQKEVHTGQDNSWHTITGYKQEYQYNSSNQLTTKLTSFDVNGDSIYEADTKTLEQFAYDENGTLNMHSTDTNTGDGIIEVLYIMEPLLIA